MGGVCSNGIDKDYFESEKITQTSEDRKGNSCLNSEAIDPNEMQQRSRSGGTLLLSPPSKTGSNKVCLFHLHYHLDVIKTKLWLWKSNLLVNPDQIKEKEGATYGIEFHINAVKS